ncbi:putative multi-domain containing protein [Aduncisulcus paluster]|uniref:Multi-domain containing protein n=1 Tax=Aduncisulcus paluster TaxID=2918883 RepID=A0ABQ5KQI5_9EUKA|nr:putative multi-domain containing protein [Aduncisulcus paluster]|eukprot:gnl/Carplike_NY0171/2900_a3900_464.p1 GENE.gnl/Carplike_NY0171/2900_a3900_464~~gnl/Carplike_NY0171/2900_a3900_464.p1  ORF type:complete len:245 (+),score=51.28 gnl/Carplike_NY0171/2900_a3900_464:55-789(+)
MLPKSISTADDVCSKKWQKYQHDVHKKKLKHTRSTVNNSSPRSYTHLRHNFKKAQMKEDMYAKIERENSHLLSRMCHIMGKDTVLRHKQPDPRQGPMTLHGPARQQRLAEITRDNMGILKRIQEKQPEYSRIDMTQWWRHHQTAKMKTIGKSGRRSRSAPKKRSLTASTSVHRKVTTPVHVPTVERTRSAGRTAALGMAAAVDGATGIEQPIQADTHDMYEGEKVQPTHDETELAMATAEDYDK